MAKVKLSDKLRVSGSDLSDLAEMRVPPFLMITSVILVTIATWFFTVATMRIVLSCNHYLFRLLTNPSSGDDSLFVFIGIIVFFACVRAILYLSLIHI